VHLPAEKMLLKAMIENCKASSKVIFSSISLPVSSQIRVDCTAVVNEIFGI
jgi:hypothetical protein